MGLIFLGEKLRLGQGLAVGLAIAGVLYLTTNYGSLPWIGLTLALSFGIYGLLKKTTSLLALEGMFMETALIIVPAAIYLIYLEVNGTATFRQANLQLDILLIFSGVVTAIPLLFFAAAAQRIPLYLIGLMQYIAPTITFLLGVFMYHEPLTQTRLIGFSLIWVALGVYSLEGMLSIQTFKVFETLKVCIFNTFENPLR